MEQGCGLFIGAVIVNEKSKTKNKVKSINLEMAELEKRENEMDEMEFLREMNQLRKQQQLFLIKTDYEMDGDEESEHKNDENDE